MSLLTSIQNVSDGLGLPSVSSVINNTDATVRQLRVLAETSGRERREEYRWPQLNREYTFTLVAGQADYSLPSDFNYLLAQTLWNRGTYWPLQGPYTPVEWQEIKSGIITASIRNRFRVKGSALKQFYIDPTPSASDAGQTIVFEYQSTTWILPIAWAASTLFNAGAYCSYNGNIYKTTLGGTTGSTAPTHTSGSSSDGGVSWTYQSTGYEAFTADTDTILIDQNIIQFDAMWRFMHAKGLQWQNYKIMADNAARLRVSSLNSGRVLSLVPGSSGNLLSINNVPDHGFG